MDCRQRLIRPTTATPAIKSKQTVKTSIATTTHSNISQACISLPFIRRTSVCDRIGRRCSRAEWTSARSCRCRSARSDPSASRPNHAKTLVSPTNLTVPNSIALAPRTPRRLQGLRSATSLTGPSNSCRDGGRVDATRRCALRPRASTQRVAPHSGAGRWGGRFDQSSQQRRKRKTHFVGSPLTRFFASLPPASAPWSRSQNQFCARLVTRTTAIEKLNASTESLGPYCHIAKSVADGLAIGAAALIISAFRMLKGNCSIAGP